jgi:4-amino-4-deoxy-L-arabinose transferase-like glycosyltransferase
MRMALGVEHLPAFVENDEAYGALGAHGVLTADPYNWFGLWESNPTLLLVVPYVSENIFGNCLWGVRMGSVVLGTISVLATFGFSRRLVGNFPAFIAALLLAVAHTHVHWSRNGHQYIQTPTAAALILWLFVRAWTGGSLLAWLGAAVALGIGTQTYQASYAFPVLIAITGAGWAVVGLDNRKDALWSILAVELIALLILAPAAQTLLHSMSHPQALFILSPENFRKLGEHPYWALFQHTKDTVTMFNTGTDFFPNYAARRSLVDAVTAAMVPIAAVMLLSRLFSPLGWVCVTWWAAYLFLGVFLCEHPPTYQRVPTALLFSSVGVAWALWQLLATITAGFRFQRASIVTGGCLLFAAAAGVANAHFYFHEFRLARPTQHTAGLTWIMCRYAKTHTVFNATALDGQPNIPVFNIFPDFECPELKQIRPQQVTELWNVNQFTHDDKVVLIVPETVVESHPGDPAGYRIVRQFVDKSIGFPVPMPLTVYELERIETSNLSTTASH